MRSILPRTWLSHLLLQAEHQLPLSSAMALPRQERLLVVSPLLRVVAKVRPSVLPLLGVVAIPVEFSVVALVVIVVVGLSILPVLVPRLLES